MENGELWSMVLAGCLNFRGGSADHLGACIEVRM
jgi:hypothetical protein